MIAPTNFLCINRLALIGENLIMPRKIEKDWEKLIKENSKCIQLEPFKTTRQKISFQCHCGNIFKTTVCKVGSGHTSSCGCARGRQFQGGELICQDFYGRLARGAEQRSISVEISISDIEKQLIAQNLKCALTGRTLIFGKIPIGKYTASVDRIDSSKGYTKDNIQILHKDVNLSKQSMSQEDFITMCKEIAEWKKN